MKRALTLLTFLAVALTAPTTAEDFPKHEADYVSQWCSKDKDSEVAKHYREYRIDGGHRIDCYVKTNDESKPNVSVEFDFSKKWAEAVGQALFYAAKTGSNPAIVFIQHEETSNEAYKTHYENLLIVKQEVNKNIKIFCINSKGNHQDCPK